MKRNVLAAAAVVLAAVACESRREPEPVDRSTEQLSRIADDSVAAVAEGTAPGLVTPDTAGAGSARALEVEPLGGSQLRGTGTAAPAGNATQLILNLTDAPPNERVEAIVTGQPCPGGGEQVARIGPIVTDASGGAESASRLTTAPGTLLNGRHSVRIEVRTSSGLEPAGCANIPSAATLPPARP